MLAARQLSRRAPLRRARLWFPAAPPGTISATAHSLHRPFSAQAEPAVKPARAVESPTGNPTDSPTGQTEKRGALNIHGPVEKSHPLIQRLIAVLKTNKTLNRSDLHAILVEDHALENLTETECANMLNFLTRDVVYSDRTMQMPMVQYVVNLLEERGRRLTEPMLLCVLEVCAATADLAVAQQTLKRMARHRVKPTFRTYALVVQTYVSAGGFAKADALLARCAERLPAAPLSVVYSRYAFALARRFSDRRTGRDERKQVLARVRQIEELMDAQPALWTGPLVNSLVSALTAAGLVDEARARLRVAEAEHAFVASDDTYLRLMRPYKKRQAWDQMAQVFDEMAARKLPISKNSVWATMMLVHISLQDYDRFWDATRSALARGGSILYADGKAALALLMGPGTAFRADAFIAACRDGGMDVSDAAVMRALFSALREGYALKNDFEGVHNVQLAERRHVF